MRVKLARTAGFCMGVRRAMETALGLSHQVRGPLYTYGPLIHNPQVLDLLADKGVTELTQIPEKALGTVLIRAHGVPPEEQDRLRRAGLEVVNATCPRVIRVQAIIRRCARRGDLVVIVGDAEHAEVVGLLGYAGGAGRVASAVADVADLPDSKQVVVVAQTTQRRDVYDAVVAAIRDRYPSVEVHDTICHATSRRQDEVRRLAGLVDGVVVVGGYNSGNTRRLAEVAKEAGVATFHVETERELDRDRLRQLSTMAVTAGASTPNWMIRKVVREIEAIRGRGESAIGHALEAAFRFMVRSHLLVALGAAALTAATSLLQRFQPDLILSAIAFCYIHSMHILNHFLDKEAGEYNDPDRAKFLVTYRPYLVAAGSLSAVLSLVLGMVRGRAVFIFLLAISVIGVLYSAPVLRLKVGRWRIRRLKDVPGSKSLSAALAWGAITGVMPALAVSGGIGWLTVFVFIVVTLLVFVRSALFDVFDVQGDLIVGQETVPVLWGERRTLRLLWLVTSSAGVVLLSGPILWSAPALAWWLLPCVGYVAGYLILYQKRWMLPGGRFEGLAEANFILAGLISLVWWLINRS